MKLGTYTSDMKTINSNDLKSKIRKALVDGCSARALDNEEDFEAVMETIELVVDKWLTNRCEGCK